MKKIIGIDPGANGCIAIWHKGLSVHKMPKTYTEIVSILREHTDAIAYVEQVGLRMSDAHGGKMFGIRKLLGNYDAILNALEQLQIEIKLVHPRTWQSQYRMKRETKTDRKNRYKRIAQKYYPTIKATLWNCDAILIMNHGRLYE